jgi:NADH:ubiquinone oxidoreductase subunit F (NADH-binding)
MLSLKDEKPTYSSLGWKPPKLDGVSAPPHRFGGRRLLSISGDVKRPGVYEVPIGLPFGELLDGEEYCGGVTGPLKAVASSGPSGGFLPARFPIPDKARKRFAELRAKWPPPPPADASPPKPLTFEEWFVLAHLTDESTHVDLRTLPLDKAAFDWLKSSGIAPLAPLLGAGIAVYADGADMLDQAVNFSTFFRNESCGKCVPCRIGTQKLVQLGTGLVAKRAAGELSDNDLAAAGRDITDLTLALTQTSICSLGGSASSPLASALMYFAPDARPTPPAVPHD